jgi:hypothetical protein
LEWGLFDWRDKLRGQKAGEKKKRKIVDVIILIL